MARKGEDHYSSAQPLLRVDPDSLRQTLGVLRKLGGITGIAESVASGKAALTQERAALGREVVHTFTSNAGPIMRAAAFRFGRDARLAGSIHSMFEPFGLISLDERHGARLAGLIAVGIALVARVMLARNIVTLGDIDVLLSAIHDLAAKSEAFMAVVDSMRPADRTYLLHGGIARLEKLLDADRYRIANEVTAFLEANPNVKSALGLP